jgi:hypothetical protein
LAIAARSSQSKENNASAPAALGWTGAHCAHGLRDRGRRVKSPRDRSQGPAGQRAEDALQDMDQDQHDAQDAGYDAGGSDAGGFES